jgi:hypothetical protein
VKPLRHTPRVTALVQPETFPGWAKVATIALNLQLQQE